MNQHIENECENSLMDCPLKDFGCESKFIRKELNQHIIQSQSQHLIQLVQSNKIHQTEIQKLKKENLEMKQIISKVAINLNRVLIIGGYTDEFRKCLAITESFNISTKNNNPNNNNNERRNEIVDLKFGPSLNFTRFQHSSLLFRDSNNIPNIIVMGGVSYDQNKEFIGIKQTEILKGFEFNSDNREENENEENQQRKEIYWNNKWILGNEMNESRNSPASIELNGKIYCIGGSMGNSFINSIEEYDYNIDEWNLINSSKLNQGKSAHSVCSLNNSIYSIGGIISNEDADTYGISCSIVERWDPRIPSNNNGGKWVNVGSLKEARSLFVCLTLN